MLGIGDWRSIYVYGLSYLNVIGVSVVYLKFYVS